MITHPQEEYFVRHGLEAPLIRQVDQGAVFCFYPSGLSVEWLIFVITRNIPFSHPWEYKLSWLVPVHNGYKDGQLFSKKWEDVIIQYEDYEDWIYQWTGAKPVGRPHNSKAIVGKDKTILSCWHMFLVQYDDWLVNNASGILKNTIFDSVDADRSIEDRMESHKNALSILKQIGPSAARRFDKDVLFYAENYCDWLVELLNKRTAD